MKLKGMVTGAIGLVVASAAVADALPVLTVAPGVRSVEQALDEIRK